ncbi:hypothetical protein KNE206_27820 [Kitasatospora sp. NE20-6]|uniref:Rv3235 family protein n=1 Tax=Kitasatospora sp. NE20-6 TaxID=2859066 RepID=UPI0034DC5165
MAEHRTPATATALSPAPATASAPAPAPAPAPVRPVPAEIAPAAGRAVPLIRPLVHAPGHPQSRRPVRAAHPGRRPAAHEHGHGGHEHEHEQGHEHGHGHPRHHRAALEPRVPRHPRAGCAPSRGAGQGDVAARFAHRLVEVLTGVRPVGQLQRHTTLQAYQQLTALVRGGPLRPRGTAPRTRLGRVYDSAPGPGALEVCVRVEFGPRHHMVAFRLERHRRTEQWQCAAVESR